MRQALGGAALVVALLSGCGGAATAQPVEAAPVAQTVSAPAETMPWKWSCAMPMTVTPIAGPGVTLDQIDAALVLPVQTLTDLGYNVTVGEPATYHRDVQAAEHPGQVIVVATDQADQQPELDGAAARTLPNVNGANGSQILAATIVVDADPAVGDLSGNILTHEFGHVLGLDHRPGTVMALTWDAPDTFDAAETAVIDCRH